MTVTNLDMLGAVGHWELVGRADDLSRLSAAAEDPSTRGLVLSGRPGIGKSRLLREGVGRLPAEWFTVLVAAADTAGPDLPFGGLAQVLPPGPPARRGQPAAAARAGDGGAPRRGDQPGVRGVAVDRPAEPGAQPRRFDRRPDRRAQRRGPRRAGAGRVR
jgi:hypothetical protein